MSTIYTVNGKVLKNADNGKWLTKKESLVLPGWTIRIKMEAGSSQPSISGAEVTPVAGQEDVYDVRTTGRYEIWGGMFTSSIHVTEILGANVWDDNHTKVAKMTAMCQNCSTLTKVAAFDANDVQEMGACFQGTSITSIPALGYASVTTAGDLFKGCTALTEIPATFELPSATNVGGIFNGCVNVESGALALYNKLSALGGQIMAHGYAFADCGSNTVTGAAELAQIPSSWGGTGA